MKLTAQDLQIDDWVMNTHNKKPEQVCEILERTVMMDYNDLYDYDEIEPIPITPEILEKTLDKSKEQFLSFQIQAYLNTASDELFAKGKPLYSEERLEEIHKCMLMWQTLHNAYFYRKPAWSEKDEYTLKGIVDEIEANKNSAPDYDTETYDRFLSWLKSIKQRITNN